MTDAQDRQTLKNVSMLLARVHRALINSELDHLQNQTGQPIGPAARLGLLLEDPKFQWMRTLSGLMAAIDEVSYQKEPITEEQYNAIGSQLKLMFIERKHPEFSEKYFSLLPTIPELFLEHGNLRAAILDWSPH